MPYGNPMPLVPMMRKFVAFFSLFALLVLVLVPQPVLAKLPSTTAIKDARILLRNALPIDNQAIRSVQQILEVMPKEAKLKRWGSLRQSIKQVQDIVINRREEILGAVNPARREEAEIAYAGLVESLVPLQKAIENKKRLEITPLSEKSLTFVTTIEEDMVQKFPFTVPQEYRHIPQLKGRALVEMVTNKGVMKLMLDGYNAPVNSGQFAALVQEGFYDGLTFNRADEGFYVQAGDPEGEADGYIDPATGKVRTVPLEIAIPGQPMPIYGKTLAEAGFDRVLPVLPFSAYGTLAMAHSYDDPNGGSSQFFLYLFESDLTPAGLNLMDGNYSVFGYLVEGEEVLRSIRLGDKIISARLVEGQENLELPPSLAPLQTPPL